VSKLASIQNDVLTIIKLHLFEDLDPIGNGEAIVAPGEVRVRVPVAGHD
jgi:hypothetical protein